MESHDDKRWQLIARAIAAGGSADGGTGEGWLQLWSRLATHLSPLIGESGFTALLRRTMRLVSTEYDWLSALQATSTPEELLAGLCDQFAEVDPGMARDANTALLSIFTKLLSGLIGEALTIRLLVSAWTDALEKPGAREQT